MKSSYSSLSSHGGTWGILPLFGLSHLAGPQLPRRHLLPRLTAGLQLDGQREQTDWGAAARPGPRSAVPSSHAPHHTNLSTPVLSLPSHKESQPPEAIKLYFACFARLPFSRFSKLMQVTVVKQAWEVVAGRQEENGTRSGSERAAECSIDSAHLIQTNAPKENTVDEVTC